MHIMRAFDACASLTTIDFGLVNEIDLIAFQFCTSLTTLDFGQVNEIGDSAFQFCNTFWDIGADEVVEQIGYSEVRITCFST